MCKYWKKSILAFFTFSLLFYLGYVLAQQSWNGDRFILLMDTMSPSSVRNIASINSQSAFFENSPLTEENKAAFLNEVTVEDRGKEIAFIMPHFLVLTDSGESVLVCERYQRIHITFISPGLSFHGHAPQMTLRAECGINKQNPLQMGPFFIPKEQILQSSLDQELFQSDSATVFMNHNYISWPNRWMLSQIRLLDNNNKELTIILGNTEDAFIFNW